MRHTDRVLIIALLSSLPCAAMAFDNGQYTDVPDNIRSWFKSVRSPRGVPCCDIAEVPQEAVVHNAGNPVGEAVVWYVRQGDNSYYIRCFVPGEGV